MKLKHVFDPHPCPICKSNERELFIETIDRHYNIKGNWKIGKCCNCDLVQLVPMLSAQDLIKLYPEEEYYAYDISKHKQLLKKFLKKIFVPTLLVKDPKFDKPGNILDYGCGTGWALLNFKNKGWDCTGIEPSRIASMIGREQLHLEIFEGTFHTIDDNLINKKFDYIRANHSLEHDPDIDKTIHKFFDHLSSSGKILIGVPNINSFPFKLFKKYWWYLGAPVHTYNFSTKHLESLLNKNGFDVLKVRYCGNYTGILGSIQMYFNRNKPNQNPLNGFIFNFPLFIIVAQLFAFIFNLFQLGDAIEVTAQKKKNVL